MKNSQLLKNTIWYGVIPKITSIINLFLLPITTPYLTRADYGIIGLINSYSSLFFALGTLGLHMHLPNSFFEYGTKYKLVWRRLFALILLGTVLFALIQIVIFLFILPDTAPYSRLLIILLSVVPILFYSNQVIANNFYVLIGNPKPFVVRNLIGGIVSIFVTYYCIVHLRYGYLSWLLSASISSILVFFLFIKPIYLHEKLYPHLPKYNKQVKNYFLLAIPVMPHSLGFALLSSSDRIVMDAFKVNINDIGLYTNGYQMGEYVYFFIIAIFTALSPTLQVAFRNNDRKSLLYYFRLTFYSICTIVILLSLWMHVIYDFLIKNATLKAAYHIAIVVLFSFLFQSVYAYMSTSLFIKKKTKLILWLVFVPGIINIVLNILFLPIWGYKCVAYNTVIAYWSTAIIPFFHPYFKAEIKAALGSSFLRELFIYLLFGSIIFILITTLFYQLNYTALIVSLLFILSLFGITYRRIEKYRA